MLRIIVKRLKARNLYIEMCTCLSEWRLLLKTLFKCGGGAHSVPLSYKNALLTCFNMFALLFWGISVSFVLGSRALNNSKQGNIDPAVSISELHLSQASVEAALGNITGHGKFLQHGIHTPPVVDCRLHDSPVNSWGRSPTSSRHWWVLTFFALIFIVNFHPFRIPTFPHSQTFHGA